MLLNRDSFAVGCHPAKTVPVWSFVEERFSRVVRRRTIFAFLGRTLDYTYTQRLLARQAVHS